MPRTLAQIEAEALKLGTRSRAALVRKLLKSLEPATETTRERAWYDEAERRRKEFDEGKVGTIPTRVVLRRLKSEIGRKLRTG